MNINNLSNFVFLNNSGEKWLLFFGVFLASLIALKIFKTYIIGILRQAAGKTKTQLDDILVNALDRIRWPFFAYIAFYISLQSLNLTNWLDKAADYLIMAIAVYYGIKAAEKFIDHGAREIIKSQQTENGSDDRVMIVQLFSGIFKILIWVGAILFVLANFGYNINSLVAGMGIGGIAIALAVQNILSDIFSSFSIFFDKPFKVGDFIVLDQYKGTVKKIGIKTTRLKSLQGEELIISNNELVKSKVQNFGLMEKRRVSFQLRIDDQTSEQKVEKLPKVIQAIIGKQINAEFSRAHFSMIDQNGFVYDIVYFVANASYEDYMDIQQNINLEILKSLKKEKIDLAHNTQVVYVRK